MDNVAAIVPEFGQGVGTDGMFAQAEKQKAPPRSLGGALLNN
jgi:hypothetical protein